MSWLSYRRVHRPRVIASWRLSGVEEPLRSARRQQGDPGSPSSLSRSPPEGLPPRPPLLGPGNRIGIGIKELMKLHQHYGNRITEASRVQLYLRSAYCISGATSGCVSLPSKRRLCLGADRSRRCEPQLSGVQEALSASIPLTGGRSKALLFR